MIDKSVLVIFKNEWPKKKRSWWQNFSVVVASSKLKDPILQQGLSFVDLDNYVEPGSVQTASELAEDLSRMIGPRGQKLAKSFVYGGYELWWMHYEDLMHRFCLPYTYYKKLLEYLGGFSRVYIYHPDFPQLFRYFLESRSCRYEVEDSFSKRLPPLGTIFQALVSLPFLLWARFRRPQMMLWTNDLFDPPHDYDFRLKFIYEELYRKELKFVEFVRSLEPLSVVISHMLKRRRPVIYGAAITACLQSLASFLPRSKKIENSDFWYLVANHYLRNVRGDVWAIRANKFILDFIKVKTAIIVSTGSRSLPELLACKLLNIKTVGIQHGASLRPYNVSDYMPEFDGEKSLGVDKYGVWSDWWRDYHLKNSKVYGPDQLIVSGPMRPLTKKLPIARASLEGPIKVLLIPGQLSEPEETVRYLKALLSAEGLDLHITFRPYRDGFEDWLKERYPEIWGSISKEKILRGNIHEAIARCDVVVGSNSTGVLEALLQLKMPIFFKTQKWGDYFEIGSFNSGTLFFVTSPDELITSIKSSRELETNVLEKLRDRFFGDPYKNGSYWLVEQAEKFLQERID